MDATRTHAASAPLVYGSRWVLDRPLPLKSTLCTAFRRAFEVNSLREAAEVLRDCPLSDDASPDDPYGVIRHRGGTIGARQALLALLAAECELANVQLVLSCHEGAVTTLTAPDGSVLAIPIVVCHLKIKGRSVQIAEPGYRSTPVGAPVFVQTVQPHTMARERVALFQQFSADWCRALELSAKGFREKRKQCLIASKDTALFEDLLGHLIDETFEPSLAP